MAALTVLVGGCGNYLGSALFELLHAEAQRAAASRESQISDNLRRWFFSSLKSKSGDELLQARSLLIDMEAKVVQNCLLRHPAPAPELKPPSRKQGGSNSSWSWAPRFAYWQQGGCGNNWALGHEVQGPKHREALEGLICDLAEEADVVASVLLVHSLAGGTGSGLGAYLTELCADLLPKSCVASCCVWPYDAEVATQSFNAALSLAALQRDSEAIFLFENARCTKALERHGDGKSKADGVDLPQINQLIARDFVGCTLLPSIPVHCSNRDARPPQASPPKAFQKTGLAARSSRDGVVVLAQKGRGSALQCPLREVVATAACHPAFKLLTCRYLPQSLLPQAAAERLGGYGFNFMLRQMQSMFTRADTLDLQTPPRLNAWARSRQVRYSEEQRRVQLEEQKGKAPRDLLPNAAVAASCCLRGPEVNILKDTVVAGFEVPLWPYALHPLQTSAHPFAAFGEPSSLGLTTSCRTPLPSLRRTLEAGQDLLHAGAFVHHYEEFGVGQEDLRLALEQFEETVEAYAFMQPG
ncbi:hypothetical protein Esti_002536 [Eimeria stiedai]